MISALMCLLRKKLKDKIKTWKFSVILFEVISFTILIAENQS
jgi:hypothetical protein